MGGHRCTAGGLRGRSGGGRLTLQQGRLELGGGRLALGGGRLALERGRLNLAGGRLNLQRGRLDFAEGRLNAHRPGLRPAACPWYTAGNGINKEDYKMPHGTDWYENSRDGQLHMVDTWLTVFQTKAAGWNIPAERVTALTGTRPRRNWW